jgi:DNA-binding beta-propeller fold protein YncE/mono/diheme cytochrome c family protein
MLMFSLRAIAICLAMSTSFSFAIQQADAEENQSLLRESVAHRSPVDVALGVDGRWLITANENTDSISLIDVESGKVLDEIACGDHPADVALCLDNQHVAVSCTHSGEIRIVQVRDNALQSMRTIKVGFLPVGLAVVPDGQRCFVGLTATGEVAELDLAAGKLLRKIAVGAWPRYLALSPDGSRLAVGCSGESRVYVLDAKTGAVLYDEAMTGAINLGHMQCSADNQYVYFPWMVYRNNPIDERNIRLGWVLASRIARVRLDGPAYREAISLDVPRQAIADPHGLVMTSDERRLIVSASGTHELLVYRRPDLPFIGVGGPGDLIDGKLLADKDLFYRIDVGGRPMGMVMDANDRSVYVANYLKDCVQEIDIVSKKVTREISLGETPAISTERLGMEIFYDGRRSLDQWYSCHSCHYDGGTNSKAMDTWNDGSPLTSKTVLPLYDLQQTGPWTWHGWQTSLDDAMDSSFTKTMQRPGINAEDARAVLDFFETLQLPPNPFLNPDGSFSEAALRGQEVFHSQRAACANCHSGDHFTDGDVHDLGLGSAEDKYEGFNTPSLLGVYRKVRLLHDGRAKSLEDLLTNDHAPEKVSGDKLTDAEIQDLIAYLKSL